MENLTERERRVYEYICGVLEKNGYSPSVRDIQTALGIKSTSTVHSYIERLESKGYIKREQGKSRTLRAGSDEGEPRSVKIPIVGMGGISSARDVIEMMLAGATAVEVGAANLVDPLACKKIIEELPSVMEEYKIENLTDIIGVSH